MYFRILNMTIFGLLNENLNFFKIISFKNYRFFKIKINLVQLH